MRFGRITSLLAAAAVKSVFLTALQKNNSGGIILEEEK